MNRRIRANPQDQQIASLGFRSHDRHRDAEIGVVGAGARGDRPRAQPYVVHHRHDAGNTRRAGRGPAAVAIGCTDGQRAIAFDRDRPAIADQGSGDRQTACRAAAGAGVIAVATGAEADIESRGN